jgi:glucan 1,3-beta-glucosidase
MHKSVSLFTLSAGLIAAAWWWLGAPVEMPPSPLDPGEKLYCVSYSPFHGTQSPLDIATRVDEAQIEQDLARLSKLTRCVRTYAVDAGLEHVPEIAKRFGLKVLLGVWVSNRADRTQIQINTGVALANKFPEVVQAVVVGNEVLLRGDTSPERLGEYIRNVRSRIKAPVTYADVWEFWLRHAELADAVNFVTIHILPYWEDDPISAANAADHVDAIRKRVAAGFPDKEIVIGEVGWPSAGRMREGALPSPANQARVLSDVLMRGKQEHFRVNVIEAFDQPWKRTLEGTVGGHWGLLTAAGREPKFSWGEAVSNHPHWPWQAAGGVALAGLAFAAAMSTQRRRAGRSAELSWLLWGAVAASAVTGGVLSGWAVENAPLESLGVGGWIRSIALVALAVASPVVCAAAMTAAVAPPPFATILGAKEDRTTDALAAWLGILLIALMVLAVQAGLVLSLDARYRDFPFAPLTAGAVSFALLSIVVPRPPGRRGLAEMLGVFLLLLGAIFIVWHETLANWQALWFAADLVLVAFSLLRVRAAQG